LGNRAQQAEEHRSALENAPVSLVFGRIRASEGFGSDAAMIQHCKTIAHTHTRKEAAVYST
jgi:hypothetical protein